MSAERPIDPRQALRVAAAGTVLSLSVMGAGIYGWVKQEQSPISQKCNTLTGKAENLEQELIKSGSLGTDGTLFRRLEIRNPQDPKVIEFGQIKNERDAACDEKLNEVNSLVNTTERTAALAGGLGAIFGAYIVTYQRERINKEKVEKEPQPTS